MEALFSPTGGYYPQTLSQGPHIDSWDHQSSQAGPDDESPQQRFQPQVRARSHFCWVAVGWSEDCGLGGLHKDVQLTSFVATWVKSTWYARWR